MNVHVLTRREGRLMPADAEKLEVQMAEFRGAVTSELKNVAHDLKNILQGMSAFVTNRDLEYFKEGRKSEHEGLKERVAKLENNQTWLVRSLATSIVAGIGVAWKAFFIH